MRRIATAVLMALSASVCASSLPLSVENISTASPKIKIWNVKATSDLRQGSSTATEQGTVSVQHRNGNSTQYDATLKIQSGTLFQDGEICHNYGPSCYCAETTFRLEAGAQKWKFGTPSNNQTVACPTGIQPTGDAPIRKSMNKEEIQQLKQKVLQERAAKANQHPNN